MTAMDENALVERVFLRIGSADTDEQLEVALGKFLTPILLKLNSSEDGIRTKVMELLVHINKRLKSRNKVQLPVEALLTQFQDPTATPFVTNFTILYIKMGYPRLEQGKQAELLPMLINCLEGRPVNQQNSLLLLMIPALQYLKFPSSAEKRQSMFQLRDKPQISKLLLDYMMDILLLPYSAHALASSTASGPVTVPPGLSEYGLKRVLGENPMNPESLEKAKLGILTFLGADILAESDIVCHYVIASSDTRHSVATSADMELKRIMGSIDWNSTEILNKLYRIFQGTVVIKGQTAVKPEQRRVPVCTRIRLKIFPFFLKSKEAVSMFPSCIQVVFDCLFGANLNAKLRIMAVQFVHHICYNCDATKFKMFDAVLLSGMVKLIGEAKEDNKLRSLAYVAVGKIARRSPERVAKDITLIQQFFESVCQEDVETRLAVQEALSLMSDAFRQLDPTNLKLMEALIMQYMDKTEPQARSVAVQYAVAVFPSNHIPSRYILLLASGDTKDDIRGEAMKALTPASDTTPTTTTTKSSLPDFVQMTQYIKEKASQRKESHQRYTTGNTVLPFNPTAYTQMLIYLRMCLSNDAGGETDIDTATEMMNQAPLISKYVNKLLIDHPDSAGPIYTYIDMLKQLLAANSDPKTMFCLLEVVAVAADKLAPEFLTNIDWLKTYMFSTKEEIRQYATQLYAILIMHSGNHNLISDTLQELFTNIKSKSESLEIQHGSLLTLGYMIGRQMRNNYTIGRIEDMDHASTNGHKDDVTEIVKTMVSILKGSNASLSLAACTALGEIGRNAPLPLPSGGEGDNKEQITQMAVINHLISMLTKSEHTNKSKEKAAMALGYICIGETQFAHQKYVMSELFNAVTGKQVDLQFTIGEALVCVAEGKKSILARDLWVEDPTDYQNKVSDLKDEMCYYIQQLLTVYIPHNNQHLRQAACIWLLILLRKAGGHVEVQKQIIEIQRAFMKMLSENDEITQDIASKGLGLVYENCTPQQKDLLVSQLVDTLTTGKTVKHEVTADTAVFAEGSIGKTPDGGSLSTYKELCSIANDLNQPDLVYKFMHLAHHNAVWNSRKGAAFGFSTIAAQAGEQLAPFLPQMVPKLFRYQFDPNPKIQQAMSSIWNALVKDNKKTVDTYMSQILDDLLKNLTSNQWRIRESSCLAVNDLLRGRQLDDVIDQLPVLWETILRVRDDIKESVRTAAHTACKTLSRVSVKICDLDNGKVGVRAIEAVLPCLLTNTLHSTVQEVRAIGLSTILEISKKAGKLLKPHIPVLVIALLEAVSGLEPQVMNYLSLHTGTQGTQEKLDSVRIAHSKMSPMMETVNKCVQYVDDSILPELVPRLSDLIKSGIGVATKAGCSSFVISLVHHCPNDLAPHAGKLMASFLNGANDRNLSVRKAYASALGHLAKIAKDSSVEKLIVRIKSWYLEKEDENAHSACGLTLHAMSRHSSDALQRNAGLAMPLAFFAMHQKKKIEEGSNTNTDPTVTIWEEVWHEITPSTESGIRLYLGEIVTILQSSLDSQSWDTKAQAAIAMGTVATELGASLSSPHLNNLLVALISGLQGRTWEGKEELLKALSTVCTSCREAILKESINNQPAIDQIIEVVIKECRKDKAEYRLEAWKCMCAVLEEYQIDRFKEMWDIMIPVLEKSQSKTKGDEDDDMGSNMKQTVCECIYLSLGQCWPHTPAVQEECEKKFLNLLITSLPVSTWKVQLSILKSLQKYIERLHVLQKDSIQSTNEETSENISSIIQAVLPLLGSATKYSALRVNGLAIIETLLLKLTEGGALNLTSTSDTEELLIATNRLNEDGTWEVREKATKVLQLLTGNKTG